MSTLKQIILGSVFIFALISTVTAQDINTAVQKSALTITANATGDRVRITAPASVVQMHLEVYAASGEKLFDQEIRGGNIFDWHLQDGQAQRLASGSYVCVVTAKSISGKLTQKLGSVTVADNSVSVQPADSHQISVQQTQAIGPIEENASLTILSETENQTTTVIANDGNDGQLIRGRGALSFRLGDFFSGKDEEQMRLTEDGNLGIGTSQPKSKLDVAGAIRAERFLVVKPKLAGDKTTTDSGDSAQPLVSGTGTQNQIAKWTDMAGTTLGDSAVTESGGNVGIGTANPAYPIDLLRNGGGNGTGLQLENSGTMGGDDTQITFKTHLSRVFSMGLNRSTGMFTLTPNSSTLGGAGSVAIDAISGSVGIGTMNPAYPIDLLRNGGGNGTGLQMENSGTAGGDDTQITFKTHLSRVFSMGLDRSTGMFTFTPNSTTLGGAGSMAIDAINGNVGIGKTPSFGRLDVAGIINSSSGYAVAGAQILSAQNNNSTLVGSGAGLIHPTGADNSFFGFDAGEINTTGFANTFLGSQAGNQNGTEQDNTFVGYQAGSSNGLGDTNSIASYNTFVGSRAGHINETGFGNTFLGFSAGADNRTENANTLIGFHAGANIGFNDPNSTASSNTLVGFQAGIHNVTGSSNTFVGDGADFTTQNATGDNNTLLGNLAGVNSGVSNGIAIGANSLVAQSNSLVLGSINGTNSATANTNVGIGTTAPLSTLDVVNSAAQIRFGNTTSDNGGYLVSTNSTQGVLSGGAKWNGSAWVAKGTGASLMENIGGTINFYTNGGLTAGSTFTPTQQVTIGPSGAVQINGSLALGVLGAANTTTSLCRNSLNQIANCNSSSLRYKTNVTPFLSGLDIVSRLRPISFTWKQGGARDVGFGAEDVARVEPLFTFKNEKGEIEGVKYDRLSVVLVNAVKEQQQQISQQQEQIATLRTANTALNSRLRLIERTMKNRRGPSHPRH